MKRSDFLTRACRMLPKCNKWYCNSQHKGLINKETFIAEKFPLQRVLKWSIKGHKLALSFQKSKMPSHLIAQIVEPEASSCLRRLQDWADTREQEWRRAREEPAPPCLAVARTWTQKTQPEFMSKEANKQHLKGLKCTGKREAPGNVLVLLQSDKEREGL